MKRSLIIVIACVILLLSIVQVVVSNRISTTGVALGKLQDEIKKYKTQNYLYSERLLLSSSLTKLYQSADSLGFVESKTSVLVTSPLPIAKRP